MSPIDQTPGTEDQGGARRDERSQPFSGESDGGGRLDTQNLVEHGKQIQEHAVALYREVGATLSEARQFVERSMQEHPVATLGAAAGAGYVLAGGLSSSLTRFAVRTGSRLAAAWAFKEIAEKATGSQIKVEPNAEAE